MRGPEQSQLRDWDASSPSWLNSCLRGGGRDRKWACGGYRCSGQKGFYELQQELGMGTAVKVLSMNRCMGGSCADESGGEARRGKDGGRGLRWEEYVIKQLADLYSTSTPPITFPNFRPIMPFATRLTHRLFPSSISHSISPPTIPLLNTLLPPALPAHPLCSN
jgi:hypothetical protein